LRGHITKTVETVKPAYKAHVTRDRILTGAAVALLLAFLCYADRTFSAYSIRILNTVAIFIILAVTYNLINGVTGQFSLGPNAFLLVGAYTSALLTLSPQEKLASFIIEPIVWPLSVLNVSFPVSLIAAGAMAALIAFLMAVPVFRVRGDYLAIVTLGFGEVMQVIANNTVPITNGPLGLKGLYPYTTLWWTWGLCIFTVICTVRLVNSTYGRAMKAVREDETAAEAMGIDSFWTKTLAFTFSAFFAGVAGSLLAHLITTISPSLFTFFLTFNLLIIIVVGGLGSTTGAVIGAILFAWGGEALRVVEEPLTILGYDFPGIPGMRMVIFSFILILVMIFARSGIMGRHEFTWQRAVELGSAFLNRMRRTR
jgi:branched-chain amino acid transport system permease protein